MTIPNLTLNRNRHNPGSRCWRMWNNVITKAERKAEARAAKVTLPFNPSLSREERRELRAIWRAETA